MEDFASKIFHPPTGQFPTPFSGYWYLIVYAYYNLNKTKKLLIDYIVVGLSTPKQDLEPLRRVLSEGWPFGEVFTHISTTPSTPPLCHYDF